MRLARASSRVAARLGALLEREYRLRIEKLTPFFELPDRAVYRADTAAGEALVVRLFPATRPLDRIEGDAAVLRYAAAAGIPAEQHVAAADGRASVQLGGRGLMVTRHVAGGRPDRDEEGLRQMGEIAGRLSSLLPAPGDVQLNRRAGSLPREDLAQGRAWLDRVRAVPGGRRDEVEVIGRALDGTSDCESLPAALIHPDCQAVNAIRDGEGTVTMIDWAGAGLGPRIVPLGLVLFSCVVQTAEDDPPALDLGRVEPIVEGFCRHGIVTVAELDHLADAVRFRPLVIAARELAQGIGEERPRTAHGWWSRYPDAEAIAGRARGELERRLGL